jgi:hypothetical protein
MLRAVLVVSLLLPAWGGCKSSPKRAADVEPEHGVARTANVLAERDAETIEKELTQEQERQERGGRPLDSERGSDRVADQPRLR